MKIAFQILLSIVFISVFAQITINLPTNTGNIPITGQTFAVLLVGYAMPRPWGMLSLLAYLLLGGIGLPIFADGNHGWEVITGNSGGFLLGFVVAAGAMGYLRANNWSYSFSKSLLAMTIGTLIILLFGVGRLTYLFNVKDALAWGLYPFVWGAIIKIVLGAAVLPLYHSAKKRFF